MLPERKFDDFAQQPVPEPRKPDLRVVPGSGLELFTCKRQAGGLKLTKNGCSDLFKRAQLSDLDKYPHLAYCLDCEVGKENSDGLNILPRLPKTCVRCERPNIRRLCGKLLCVSCFNRGREMMTGKNARGAVPVRFIPLHIFDYADSLIVVGRDQAEALRVVAAMTGTVDLQPELLIDYGVASPAEVDSWWRFTIKPWSAKRSRISSVKL